MSTAHPHGRRRVPHRLAVLLLLLGLFGLLPPSSGDDAPPLRLGVFPYFSPEQLAALHKPLKDHLQAALGRRIRLVSAPDFRTFRTRTAQGRYDILITAPHFGRLAERQAGYRWLGFTANHSEAVFVAPGDSGLRRLEDLRGHRLALPPRLAIIHQMALETLERHGLEPGRDVQLLERRSHDRALYAVLQGDAHAAAFGLPTWRRYRAPDKERLRVVARSEPIPGFALMAHPELDGATVERLREALHGFAATARGRQYFDSTGLEGVREATAADFRLLDHYLARIRAARERP